MTTELLLIGGVDEAGRGPLAGAVYAAAVILDPARPIAGLADSKTLSEKKRDSLAAQIKEYALSWAIASSSVAEIDRINILQASLLAMKRAVEGLHLLPERILVDGLHCPKVTMSAQAVVSATSSSWSRVRAAPGSSRSRALRSSATGSRPAWNKASPRPATPKRSRQHPF